MSEELTTHERKLLADPLFLPASILTALILIGGFLVSLVIVIDAFVSA